MQKIIFTEEYCKPENLHPFTYTRHIQDIRVGILTIREKWERYLKLPSADKWEDYYLDTGDSVRIDKQIGNDEYLLVHANVLPTAAIIGKVAWLSNSPARKYSGSIRYASAGRWNSRPIPRPFTIPGRSFT